MTGRLTILATLTLAGFLLLAPAFGADLPKGQVSIRNGPLNYYGAVVGMAPDGRWCVITVGHALREGLTPEVRCGDRWVAAEVVWAAIPPGQGVCQPVASTDAAILLIQPGGYFQYQQVLTNRYCGPALVADRTRLYAGVAGRQQAGHLQMATATRWERVNGLSGGGVYAIDGRLIGIQRATWGSPDRPTWTLVYNQLETYDRAFQQLGWSPTGWRDRNRSQWEPLLYDR